MYLAKGIEYALNQSKQWILECERVLNKIIWARFENKLRIMVIDVNGLSSNKSEDLMSSTPSGINETSSSYKNFNF